MLNLLSFLLHFSFIFLHFHSSHYSYFHLFPPSFLHVHLIHIYSFIFSYHPLRPPPPPSSFSFIPSLSHLFSTLHFLSFLFPFVFLSSSVSLVSPLSSFILLLFLFFSSFLSRFSLSFFPHSLPSFSLSLFLLYSTSYIHSLGLFFFNFTSSSFLLSFLLVFPPSLS